MFITTSKFNESNADDYASLPLAAENFSIINEVIERIKRADSKQSSGEGSRAVESKTVLRAAIRQKMKDYARTARALNIDDAGFRRLFRIPDSDSDQYLIAVAREFVAGAIKYKAEFASLGIEAALADNLDNDADALENAIGDKAGADTTGTGATAEIEEAVETGMKAASILDAIMKNVYRNNPVKLAEWMSARHVKRLSQRKP